MRCCIMANSVYDTLTNTRIWNAIGGEHRGLERDGTGQNRPDRGGEKK